ncbi:hypothetical protein Poli38472_005049 [Pythium oligandrum]|uniref:glucan 1,3-beta-glucosidase n=1 Tax=Pythium oligandrum TaxID=41045 RepID=A0A8K1FH80_PYTOL|nr:hypothetical protein Poli38472_005049 [Pythium oligandrum]|eukprot:TMW62431.1 hypothetical protein Poli38472_005049 [Pythium oligandrum]
MIAFKALQVLTLALMALGISAEDIQYKIRRGETPSRAVNLGSWLVGEYWMSYHSPAWAGVPEDVARGGEYAAMKYLGHEKGDKQFDEHRRTWIQIDDIKEIKTRGLNTVRVPVGFWMLNDDSSNEPSEQGKVYAPNSLYYLDQLIKNWTVQHEVAVMLSLHAHQGSQNGFDHSGPVMIGDKKWFESDENVKTSLNLAAFLAKRYKDQPSFLGLNLMNEPNNNDKQPILEKYYVDAYTRIRDAGNDCIIVTSPMLGQQTPPFMDHFMLPTDHPVGRPDLLYTNVWHELHAYFIWGYEGRGDQDVINAAAGYKTGFIDAWHGNPLFIGEFCLDGPNNSSFADRNALVQFGKTQLETFSHAKAGWAFGAWRHDDEQTSTSGWSMRQLLREHMLTLA